MRTKVKALLVLATSIGLLLGFVQPQAHALSFGDALVYSGRAIPLTCDAQPPGDIGPVDSTAPGVLTCPIAGGNGVPFIGGSGTFGFVASQQPTGTPAEVCVGVSDNDLGVPEAAPCDTGGGTHPGLSASGTYSSLACGTGIANGTATAYESDSSVNVTFTIPFFGGVGVTYGTSKESDSSGTGTVYGVVALGLDQGDFVGQNGVCASGFRATGATVVIDPTT